MIGRSDHRVNFHFLVKPFHFSRRTELKEFLLSLFKKEGHKVMTVNYIFCTDAYLLKINQDFLHHNTYTDIITFGLSRKNEPIVADIYISVDRVKENALLFQSRFVRELHRVIFHGALHLCGYEDKSSMDAKKMRSKEDHYLHKYFVSRETRVPKS